MKGTMYKVKVFFRGARPRVLYCYESTLRTIRALKNVSFTGVVKMKTLLGREELVNLSLVTSVVILGVPDGRDSK